MKSMLNTVDLESDIDQLNLETDKSLIRLKDKFIGK